MTSRPSRSRPGRSTPGGRRPSSAGRGVRTSARPPSRPAAPKKVEPAGTGRRLTTRAIVLLSVVLLLIASYTSTLHAWWEARADIQATRAEIAMRKQNIADLEDQQARWDDPAYVKQQARERFGWVMPGEVGYRVIGSDGVVRGEVPTLDAPPEAATAEWYDKLWGSVQQAGREPVPDPAPAPDEVLKKE